jgi:hypothetical protein
MDMAVGATVAPRLADSAFDRWRYPLDCPREALQRVYEKLASTSVCASCNETERAGFWRTGCQRRRDIERQHASPISEMKTRGWTGSVGRCSAYCY